MRTTLQRRRIRVRGIVQGVGFRPFVYQEARRHRLTGFVGNDADGVFIEAEGAPKDVSAFVTALRDQAPPLARVDGITEQDLAPRGGEEFTIVASRGHHEQRNTLIAPDSAICADCLAELLDPADRRHRYPFINCTNCGPRFTISRDIPYDRANTTMSGFPLCARCRAEYTDPADRRFHAQPNACPDCGPRLSFADRREQPGPGDGPLDRAARLLADGGILAVKGLGGFHLACDATDPTAVAELRRRKGREAKPLAVMVPDLATAESLCAISAEERRLLESPQRPIVLLRRHHGSTDMTPVAPDTGTLGVMLPYTPMHHVLLDAYRAVRPVDRPAVLVMTSANASDDPIVYRDEDALAQLPGIADAVLLHDRPIHMRCDDSLVRMAPGGPQVLRRARGHAPAPVTLPEASPVPLLACGSNNKATFCLVKDDQAFVSHHIGKLDAPRAAESYARTVEHYRRLFDVAPVVVVHDYHPRYRSTRYALESGIPVKIGVQHHEAHIASVIAEHRITGQVIGVAADGTGHGPDGTIWGGEVLVGGLRGFSRFAHLTPVPLPGARQAVRRPWMLGYVYLRAAFGDDADPAALPLLRELPPERTAALDRLIADRAASPLTSSAGRLFDAVSAILGLRHHNQYEGQAAVALEELALRHRAPTRALPPTDGVLAEGGPIDTPALVRALVEDLRAGCGLAETAHRFHVRLATVLAARCRAARRRHGLDRVALSGGVFQNTLLLGLLTTELQADGFTVYRNAVVPCNDGGLSLGQAAIAAARLRDLLHP
ncbi:carbamoyltransferase HypF [Kitasatospora cineracea]|uniref:Carbamoyltransferase n=1 Tax=Kitasatospora cineracea TaxID=88074 RepID=A0A8G1X861_9ACTN|nr:carbamoyltransferase HypF [Kitasatospora cineracea]ROR37427.1 hydrogenase maturation protein HypF [Kitasatospora cineracea]